MNFLEELKWRGMIHQMTPGTEAQLNDGMVVGYIGFDPTAPSLTIGNYVQVMLLSLFQRAGHKPIVLMGGATGRVGDPSGKDKERELKSYEELDRNLAFQAQQFAKFLDFGDAPNSAILVNNLDFYKDMNVLDFLRDVGKTLTVNYMSSKDSVKKRLETGLSFTEFSYQLLQAYDFQCLYTQRNCRLQMGGSDQWGNITSGTEFIRRNVDGKANAVTTPLLTKADGSKFGKSEQGNIWLSPEMTSPYQFYQFWINAADADLPSYLRYFTLKSKEEVEAMEAVHRDNPNELKRLLAEELTIRVHSKEDYENVLRVSQLLFRKANKATLLELNEQSLASVAQEIPSSEIARTALTKGITIIDLLTEQTQLLTSNSEVRKAIKNNAIALNKDKINNHMTIVNEDDLLHGKYLMIENGKKNKFMLIAK
ncbi:MAG: tyrosine--tRNA ligase [Bacteroidota bacterium]